MRFGAAAALKNRFVEIMDLPVCIPREQIPGLPQCFLFIPIRSRGKERLFYKDIEVVDPVRIGDPADLFEKRLNLIRLQLLQGAAGIDDLETLFGLKGVDVVHVSIDPHPGLFCQALRLGNA